MTTRRWLAVIVVAALALRLAFLATDPQPEEAAGLSGAMGQIAHNILEGHWFQLNGEAPPPAASNGDLTDPSDQDWTAAHADPDYYPYSLHMQGTAILLAGIWGVTGDQDYAYLQVLQCLLAALVAWLVWWIAMRLYGRPRAALIAAGIYALHLPLAYAMRIPYYETWAILLAPPIVALMLLALPAEGRRRLGLLAAAGVATGIALYFRPPLMFIPLAVGLASIPGAGRRRGLQAALVPLAIALAMLTPWVARNAAEYDRFILANTGLGQVLWQGLGERPNDFGAITDDQKTFELVHAERPALVYGTPEYDDHLLEKATEAIREQPGFYAGLVARRAVNGTIAVRNRSWVGGAYDRWEEREGSIPAFVADRPLDAVLIAVAVIGDPLVVVLGLLGAIATRRRLWRQHIELFAVVAATLIVPLALDYEWRYVAPGLFAWIILAGLAVDTLAARLAARWP